MAWLTGWTYRKPVTISRASGAVTNYQMKLLVGESSGATGEDVDCGGLCLSTFNDLRFTASDGTTLLDYWIELVSGSAGNQLATVWIEFNSIGAGATTFYMYYGNAAASSAASGDDTFIFFDDFSGSFPGSKWTGATEYGAVSSGILTVSGNTSAVEKNIYSATTMGATSGALRIKARFNTASMGITGLAASHVARFLNDGTTLNFDTYNGGYSAHIGYWTQNAYDTWDILIRGNYNVRYFSVTAGGELLASGSPKYTNPPNQAMKILFAIQSSSDVTVTLVDWVFLRQYPSTGVEPAYGAWGAREDAPVYGSPFAGGRLI